MRSIRSKRAKTAKSSTGSSRTRADASTTRACRSRFPVVLDVELKAVDRLGIRKDLSKPATYIIDRDGRVRFAYVGANIADRPGVDAIVAQLDQIVGGESDASTSEETADTP